MLLRSYIGLRGPSSLTFLGCYVRAAASRAYSDNGVGRIDEVALRRSRLVLRWVTVHECAVLVYVSVYSGQLSRLPSAGWEISTGQGAVAVLCGWEGNRRSAFAPAMRHRLLYPPTGSVASEKETSIQTTLL